MVEEVEIKNRKVYFFVLMLIVVVLFGLNFVFAWDFYGYTYDVDGNILYNTTINISIWDMSGGSSNLVGSNFSYSNESGWFNFSISGNSSWMYKPIIRHFQENKTDGSTPIDYIGQSLPMFPYSHFFNTTDIKFYLRDAGTINITAINSTGDRINFTYTVKDTKLGFPVEENNNEVSEGIVYVPRDRNYSITIFPRTDMRAIYNWNNFSSGSSYTSSDLLSYNATTHTIQKTFNVTTNLLRITGHIQNTSGDDFADWNEFNVVAFFLASGDHVFLGDRVSMPYNMSAWNNGQTDEYNLTSGFYNITLPGPEESATYILFATARNGTNYYGGYKNITLDYSSSSDELNFTMYPLMSGDWGSANSNMSLDDANTWEEVNISTAKQQFSLINSTDDLVTQSNAFIEAKVDYSDYGAKEFIFGTQVSSGGSSFYLPLLNITGIKEMNIYSQTYAPRKIGTRTASQILSNPNITLSTFNPGDIGSTLAKSQISVALYKSNLSCDMPVPGSGCSVQNSADMDNFNPLNSVIGGGALSFRMGMLSAGIIVHYVNVDMLASGPPDASFDNAATETTSSGFDSAMRFGSNGPTIYDYVLISMPYTEGSTSTTGLNENADINLSIPNLYDDDWNVIWNTANNGTNASALAGNQSHYSDEQNEWQTLLESVNCTRNASGLNKTTPCYIDTSNNKIWVRLPHFSGTGPSVSGSVITATSSSSSSSSGGGGGIVTSSTDSNETTNESVSSSSSLSGGGSAESGDIVQKSPDEILSSEVGRGWIIGIGLMLLAFIVVIIVWIKKRGNAGIENIHKSRGKGKKK